MIQGRTVPAYVLYGLIYIYIYIAVVSLKYASKLRHTGEIRQVRHDA